MRGEGESLVAQQEVENGDEMEEDVPPADEQEEDVKASQANKFLE
jgi:hypothetical protein